MIVKKRDLNLDAKVDKTLIKGLAILERLAPADEPVRLVDLARDLGLTKSSVHRLLQTLLKLGYVSSQEGGRYAATMKMWHLGSRIVEQIDTRRTLHRFLDMLAQESKETVHLALLEGQEVVYIDKVEGQHAIRATSEIGSRAPLHCTAAGKVHLAYRPLEFVHALEGKLTRYTAKTVTDLMQLQRDLVKVRRDGYAINRAEWEEGVCGVAAPIWASTNDLASVIGVTVPATRFSQAERQRLIMLVTQVAEEASAALGARVDRGAEAA